MRQTQRTGDIGQNYTERTEGDAPSSVEVSISAKGQAQYSIKLYYATPRDLDSNVESDLETIITRIRGTLHGMGIVIAGETDSGGK